MKQFLDFVWTNLNLHHAEVGAIAIVGWELGKYFYRKVKG